MVLFNEIADESRYWNNDVFKRLKDKVESYEQDKDKVIRLEGSLCKFCYYISIDRLSNNTVIGECEICGNPISCLGNDTLCSKCATEQNYCKHCGQKMD